VNTITRGEHDFATSRPDDFGYFGTHLLDELKRVDCWPCRFFFLYNERLWGCIVKSH